LLSCERSEGVLVVFELDHRLILLKTFRTIHKGIFAQSPAFMAHNINISNISALFAALQHAGGGITTSSDRRKVAFRQIPH
jgi:hypothetical protein